MTDVRKIIAVLSEIIPPDYACDWDNCGLQVGDPGWNAGKILLALDVNKRVITEAVAGDCDMIISHHPLIFKGIETISSEDVRGEIIITAIKNEIALFSVHTNLDLVPGGLNDYLAERLKIMNAKPLKIAGSDNYCKLVVFVPTDHLQRVREVLLDNGAGHIGNYSHTSFSVEGMGTFKPLAGSDPYLGAEDEIVHTEEMRLETIVKKKQIPETVQALLQVHPYEEVAYDIYPLENSLQEYGLGRVGILKDEVSLDEYARQVKDILGIENLRLVGRDNRIIKKVATGSGSGSDLIEPADRSGADLLVTGDIKYHEARLAEELGLALIDAGHYHTEKIVTRLLFELLSEKLPTVDFQLSGVETAPWQVI